MSQINKAILNSLKNGDKYGLEIIKDIENFSNGRVKLKQPSLYSALRRMEKKGLISSFGKIVILVVDVIIIRLLMQVKKKLKDIIQVKIIRKMILKNY